MQDNGGQVVTHRVITMLGRQEMDYLDKLGKDGSANGDLSHVALHLFRLPKSETAYRLVLHQWAHILVSEAQLSQHP